MALTVQAGLVELKLLEKRINKSIAQPVVQLKQGNDIPRGYSSEEEVIKAITAAHQSTVDLIARRNAIKSAIVTSNATTQVEVAGVKMTVAEAIERKNSIDFEKTMLAHYKNSLAAQIHNIDRLNADVHTRAEQMMQAYLNGDKNKTAEAQKIYDDFVAARKAELIDPLSIKKVIDELETNIDQFEAQVDLVLSTSNAITVLEDVE